MDDILALKQVHISSRACGALATALAGHEEHHVEAQRLSAFGRDTGELDRVQFYENRLVGTAGAKHFWSIDLDKESLVMAHPDSIKLLHPRDAVEEMLGDLPRTAD